MQVRKAVAGVVLGGGMTAMAFAGAGSASASTGADGASGAVTVNKTSVSVANGNKVLSGNRTTVKLEVNVLNGAFSDNFSGNAINSPGAYSTNINKYFNSFNTVTVTKTEVTTNNTDSNNVIDSYNKTGADGKPGHH